MTKEQFQELSKALTSFEKAGRKVNKLVAEVFGHGPHVGFTKRGVTRYGVVMNHIPGTAKLSVMRDDTGICERVDIRHVLDASKKIEARKKKA